MYVIAVERRCPIVSIDRWTELWLFEYMGDIHMSEVASLSVRKL